MEVPIIIWGGPLRMRSSYLIAGISLGVDMRVSVSLSRSHHFLLMTGEPRYNSVLRYDAHAHVG